MSAGSCRIVELRRYALHPDARETLIELFEREFVEAQEDVGIHVLGQFRDLDDENSFVWLRGFRDMRARKRALQAFYGGPVWQEHRRAANATMIDADNVLLLRPVSGPELDKDERPPPGSTVSRSGVLVVTIYPLTDAASGDFPRFFEAEVETVLREARIPVLATYATERSRNTFPALPVREDLDVFVSMALFADEVDHRRHLAELEESPAWRNLLGRALPQHLDGQPEVLRLAPTARSLVHA